jgi:predicted metallo-beta-lactamase superfamily hydrolase
MNIESANSFRNMNIKSPQKQINTSTQNSSNEYFSHNLGQGMNQLEPRFNYPNNFEVGSTLINE